MKLTTAFGLFMSVLLTATSAWADSIDDFESYDIGTIGSDIFDNASVDFSEATVIANGADGSNALCISQFDEHQNFESIFLDTTVDQNPIDFGGGTSFTTSFRYRNGADFSNAGDDVSSLTANLTHFGLQNVSFSLALTGKNWEKYEIVLFGFAPTGFEQISSGLRPVSELGVTSNEVNEWSDYFSLELSLIRSDGLGGSPPAAARGALVDSQGNTITFITLELQMLPIGATGPGFSPTISTQNELFAVSQLCIDDICYTLTTLGRTGDANCDGATDLLDVEPFVQMILNNKYKHEADMNSDGRIDLLDIPAFVEVFTGP